MRRAPVVCLVFLASACQAGPEAAAPRRFSHPAGINAVAISPDSRVVAGGGKDGIIRLWELASGREMGTWPGHQGYAGKMPPGLKPDEVQSLAFSPSGKFLASAGDDGAIRLWEIPSAKLLREFDRHPEPLRCVRFSPDGLWLASASLDASIRIWNVSTGTECRRMSHKAEGFTAIFTSDGKTLISGGDDQRMRFWNPATGAPQAEIPGNGCMFPVLALSPDGVTIASGGNGLRLWLMADPEAKPRQFRDRAYHGWITDVAFSPDGRTLASAGDDGRIRLWDPVTGNEIATLPGQEGTIRSLAFSPDGVTLVAADRLGVVVRP